MGPPSEIFARKKKQIFCVEVKANLSKTNECEGFLQSEIFARIDVHAFMQKKFYLHCVKYGSAFVILCVEVKANLGKTN